MQKKVFPNIKLTCMMQDTLMCKSQDAVASEDSIKSLDRHVFSGMLSTCDDGSVLFQETITTKGTVRNCPIYEGKLLNLVRRKNGLYYPCLKSIKAEDMTNKAEYAFRLYQEISEALNFIA